jgi:hypothetical protein
MAERLGVFVSHSFIGDFDHHQGSISDQMKYRLRKHTDVH